MILRSLGCFTLAVFFACSAFGQDNALWERYKANFVSDDGRVVDYYQGQISHSEGQGYGLILSVKYGDRAAFEKIWQWTKNNLQVRSDNLSAWQWGQRPNREWSVIDYNNATDGDILIGYALLKADEKWRGQNYKSEALKIIRDIRTHLSITWHGRTFLLPGYYGFQKEDGFVVNPSHAVLTAFRSFAKKDQKAFWEKVHRDGMYLIEQSYSGKFRLPADWLFLSKDRIAIYQGEKPYFGSNAIRTILYLSSEKKPPYPKGIRTLTELYIKAGSIPLWVDLQKDLFSSYHASAGYYAIYALVAKRQGHNALSNTLLKEARKKLDEEGSSYYSFSLFLLATDQNGGQDNVSGIL